MNFSASNIPNVGQYHTLTPLTTLHQQQSQTLHGYKSTVYKAVSSMDGRTYCLRRIHGRYLSTDLDTDSAAKSYTN